MVQIKVIFDTSDPEGTVNKFLTEMGSLPDKEFNVIDIKSCNEYATRFMIIYELTDKSKLELPADKPQQMALRTRKPISCDLSYYSSSDGDE